MARLTSPAAESLYFGPYFLLNQQAVLGLCTWTEMLYPFGPDILDIYSNNRIFHSTYKKVIITTNRHN
jgi:hypothetical protein